MRNYSKVGTITKRGHIHRKGDMSLEKLHKDMQIERKLDHMIIETSEF